ncbi:MAG: hypothetical protein IJP64_02030 [Oscillospiraceae bacterium]|nr:hypothetical protein [Oscillospiraceae bacterium]
MKETFMQEMARFWKSLQYVYGVVTDTVRRVIADTSIIGRAELVVMALAALVVALLVLGRIVSFIKAPWKKKGQMLLGTLLVLFLLAAVGYFLLRMIGMPTA